MDLEGQHRTGPVYQHDTTTINSLLISSQDFYRGASYFQPFIHLHGCFVKHLAHSNESKLFFHSSRLCPVLISSGQPSQDRLESDLHVCARKQLGINKEFNALNIYNTGETGKKYVYTYIWGGGVAQKISCMMKYTETTD